MSNQLTMLSLCTSLLLSVLAGPLAAEDGRRSVTVTATGRVAAEPDSATVVVGVATDAPTAREALARNTEAMQKLLDALKSQAIEPRDIQTATFALEPQYAQTRENRQLPVVTGYRVVNRVRVLVRDVKRTGDILDRAATAGANVAGSIEFQVSTEESLRDEARRQAMANAKRRARLFAEAAGVEVGKVLTISEETFAAGPRPPMARMSAGAVPIEAGVEWLEATVTVTFELK